MHCVWLKLFFLTPFLSPLHGNHFLLLLLWRALFLWVYAPPQPYLPWGDLGGRPGGVLSMNYHLGWRKSLPWEPYMVALDGESGTRVPHFGLNQRTQLGTIWIVWKLIWEKRRVFQRMGESGTGNWGQFIFFFFFKEALFPSDRDSKQVSFKQRAPLVHWK